MMLTSGSIVVAFNQPLLNSTCMEWQQGTLLREVQRKWAKRAASCGPLSRHYPYCGPRHLAGTSLHFLFPLHSYADTCGASGHCFLEALRLVSAIFSQICALADVLARGSGLHRLLLAGNGLRDEQLHQLLGGQVRRAATQ